MLYSLVATLFLSSLVSGSILAAGKVNLPIATTGTGGDDCDEIYTFDKQFVLAVREYGCDGSEFYDLVYENECGQALHGCNPCQVYPKCECKDCYGGCQDTCNTNVGVVVNPIVSGFAAPTAIAPPPGLSAPTGSITPAGIFGGNDDKFCKICKKDEYEFFTLCDSVLKDECGKTGVIAYSHEFQFEEYCNPTDIYTSGFSIKLQLGQYLLALNHNTLFWQCPVDDKELYKIYDEKINCSCTPIELIVIVGKECCDDTLAGKAALSAFATFSTVTVETTTTV